MNGDTRSHLTSGIQRRIIRITAIVAVILVLIVTPLIVNADLRFDLAHRFGLVPDAGIEILVRDSDAVDLIVVPTVIERPALVPEVRYRATYLAEQGSGHVRLTDLDDGSTIDLPIAVMDFVSATPDGETVLFRQGDTPSSAQGVLVDAATNAVTPLPAGQLAPSDDPWWRQPVWAESPELCNAVSPNAVLIACFQRPVVHYLAGDWQIEVRVYGNPDRRVAIYRGRGFLPIIGWTADDSWLYFQNERVIGRVRVMPSDLPDA